ncbi:MAG: beta-hexosaminidase [Clostridia bacterium]|nr:beta-hexosaminidase [Clostridia bacterium]
MVDLKAKPFYLNDEQIKWVEDTINSLTLEEKVGQLFVHLTGSRTEEDIENDIKLTRCGGIRFNPGTNEEMWNMNYFFQKHSKVPILSAVNVECGGNGATRQGTFVGSEMKVAATNKPEYAYKLGQICGRETKATGSNWAFAPITDLVLNWHNPGIVTRGFGDQVEQVSLLSREYFKGMSESGILCAMKHFPGDGQDERDPHIGTAVNTLSMEEWDKSYGKIYADMIDAGIQSVMTGHIMMPAYQKHFNPNCKPEDLKPATICKELVTDLLRGKLGFNGLVVSDASHMVGLTGHGKRSDIVPDAINAGVDMFLFFNDIEEDTRYMTEAYKSGRISEERMHDALSRILAMKCLAGLNNFSIDKFPSKEGLSVIGCEEHKKVAKEITDHGITLAKQTGKKVLPFDKKKIKKILLVPVGPKSDATLVLSGQAADNTKMESLLKSGLEAHGFKVEIYVDPIKKMMDMVAKMTPEQIAEMQKQSKNQENKGMYGMKQAVHNLTDEYDAVIAFADVPHTMKTVQRLEWALSKGGWDNPWYVEELPVIFVSFSSPFHLADVSQVKNYINCYDAHEETVKALVDKLVGVSEFKGVSPVDVFCGMIDTRI